MVRYLGFVAAEVVILAGVWATTDPQSGRSATDGERERALQEQARLLQEAERLRKVGKLEESEEVFARVLKAEKALFVGPTHTGLWLTEQLGSVQASRKEWAASEKLTAEAVAMQLHFFGDRPARGNKDRPTAPENTRLAQQALAVRRKSLGEKHAWVGLTLVDLALAQEEQGHLDLAQASLEQAIKLLREANFERGFIRASLTDAHYHRERMRLSAADKLDDLLGERAKGFLRHFDEVQKTVEEATRLEAKGDLTGARAAWGKVLGGFQGFAGPKFFVSEAAQLEMLRRYRTFFDGYLSFYSRTNDSEKYHPSYFGISNFKGAVFTHLHRINLEQRYPGLAALCYAHQQLNRRLAVLDARGKEGSNKDDRVAQERGRLRARKEALEVELARRHNQLPIMMNAPPSTYLRPNEALVDYYVYERQPGPGEKVGKGRPERRLACFVSRKAERGKAVEAYHDLGPLKPVEAAAERWRRAIRAGGGWPDRGMVLDSSPKEADAGTAPAELRKLLWEPLSRDLAGADIVLISPDGILASVPFAALPGSKAGTYLIEEVSVASAPVPRLIFPMKSLTESLARRGGTAFWSIGLPPEPADAPLLVGDIDFDAAPRQVQKGEERLKRQRLFRPLKGTAKEIEQVGDLFRKVFPERKPGVLSRGEATADAVRRKALEYNSIHLATHGYFAPGASGDRALPELRSALALAGANRGPEGLLTALEVGSLDLARVKLAVLSACETGLGTAQEGEGVLGLQRAFLVAGARTTVTSLWQIDDEATQVLMVEFYRNSWERKYSPLKSLRQAQLAMLRGKLYQPPKVRELGEKRTRQLSPYYWGAFVLSGDWR